MFVQGSCGQLLDLLPRGLLPLLPRWLLPPPLLPLGLLLLLALLELGLLLLLPLRLLLLPLRLLLLLLKLGLLLLLLLLLKLGLLLLLLPLGLLMLLRLLQPPPRRLHRHVQPLLADQHVVHGGRGARGAEGLTVIDKPHAPAAARGLVSEHGHAADRAKAGEAFVQEQLVRLKGARFVWVWLVQRLDSWSSGQAGPRPAWGGLHAQAGPGCGRGAGVRRSESA